MDKAAGSQRRTVSAAAEDLKEALKAFDEQEKRAGESGHSVFDAETVRYARKTWTHLDNAADCLGMLLRNAGIEYDPVYANRPTLVSSVRPVVRTAPPAEPKPAKPKKAGAGKGNKAGGDKKNGDSGTEAGGKPADGSGPQT